MGDVTDRVNLTPVATAEGHALADSLFGGRPRTHLAAERALGGVLHAADRHRGDDRGTGGGAWAGRCLRQQVHADAAHAVRAATARRLMKLVVDHASQKVVGAHMLGEDSPEIIQGIAIAVVMGATKADFDRTIGIHPTAAEEFVTLRTPDAHDGRGEGGGIAARAGPRGVLLEHAASWRAGACPRARLRRDPWARHDGRRLVGGPVFPPVYITRPELHRSAARHGPEIQTIARPVPGEPLTDSASGPRRPVDQAACRLSSARAASISGPVT